MPVSAMSSLELPSREVSSAEPARQAGGVSSPRRFASTLSRIGNRVVEGAAAPRFVVTLRDYWKNARPPLPVAAPRDLTGGATATLPQGRQGPRPEHAAAIESAVTEASRIYNVPKKLITAVMRAESAFNPRAVSRAGAKGLMQLMDDTARGLKVGNSFDIRENVMGGAKYLRQLLDSYRNNVPFALAAYNAGPRRVDQYNGIPPYRETRDYVARVMRYYTS